MKEYILIIAFILIGVADKFLEDPIDLLTFIGCFVALSLVDFLGGLFKKRR